MNKATHIRIGRVLYERCAGEYGVRLRRKYFLLGCVLPDLCLSFLTKPHEFGICRPTVRGDIDRLTRIKYESAWFGRYYSVKLGVICHYLADFFCYPHHHDFAGGVAAHTRYERELGRYFRRSAASQVLWPDLSGLAVYDAGALIMESLDGLQRAYLREEPTYDRDIRYSLAACLEAVMLLTNAGEDGDEAREAPYDAPVAAQGAVGA